jgi:hypothetical protein
MKRVLIIISVAILLFLTVFIWVAYSFDYSDGYRVGNVIKLSNKGVMFKTYEGQLDMGFLAPGDEVSSSAIATRIWDFSVHDSDAEARKQIDDAILNGSKVKVYYNEKLWKVRFWGDTKYFVYKVEKAGN